MAGAAKGAEYVDVESTDSESSVTAPRFTVRSAAKIAGSVAMLVAGAACSNASESASPVAPVHVAAAGAGAAAVQLDALPSSAELALSDLKPLELLHDGNVCDLNEELFEGLCYKKCSLLTVGEAPIRTSAWTCCREHPCTPLNEMGKVGLAVLCSGFDVSGDGSCPHQPGACLVNEELFGGVCYKKCSVLTDGHYPNRVGPASCCDTHGLACFDPRHDKTNKEFLVGGGAEDHDPLTLASAHLPQQSLTEDSSSEDRTKASSELRAKKLGSAMPPASEAAEAPREDEVAVAKPVESMHDGNVCDDREELYGGLCYKKCSLLTHGLASIRTSSWTCCSAQPCLPWKQLGSVGTSILCNGYDISADGSCPHKPGACLMDEEMHMGVCFRKCSLLTDGAFPHRFGAATCCKTQGLGCLDILNDKTSKAFDVGGGAGDHDASTPSAPHPPLQSLTEQDTSSKRGSDREAVFSRRLRSAA